jgi:hypothetical protein
LDTADIVTLTPRATPSDPPTFTCAADATLARVQRTYIDRGEQYGDTWALPNIQCPLTEYVLSLRRDPDYRAWLRLLRAAVLADTKESRIIGGPVSIDDNLLDGIAYRATFTEFLREYEGR